MIFEDAESRLKTATAELAEAQQELSVAQQKADKIRVDGTARAASDSLRRRESARFRPWLL